MSKNQIIKNLTSNYLISLVGMALGFLLVPFLIVKLGKESYGVIILAESVTGFFDIVTMSVRMALSRHAAFSLGQKKMDEFIQYLSTGRVILFFSGALALIFGSIVSFYFPHIFKVPSSEAHQSQVLFFMITVAVASSIPNAAFWSMLYAKERFDLINSSMSLGLILRAACLFLYYSMIPRNQAHLAAYGVIYLIMVLLQNGMIYFTARRLLPGIRLRISHFRLGRVREILSFSAHTSISRISAVLYDQSATIIINVFWGPAFNAIYGIGMKIPVMMSRIFSEPSWALTPTFTNFVATGEHKRFETLFFMYSKLLAIATFPISFFLIFFSKSVIFAWVGPDFEMAADILTIVVCQQLIGIPFSITGCVFNAYGKVKVPSFVSLAMGIVNVILCLVLGVALNMKLYGIVIAGVIVATGCGEGFYPNYACKLAGFSVRRYWMNSMVKPLVLCTLVVGSGIWILRIAEPQSPLSLLMCLVLAITTTAHYFLSYRLLLSLEEKKHVLDILKDARQKFSNFMPIKLPKGSNP